MLGRIRRGAQARQFDPSHALHYLPSTTDTLIDVGCNAGEILRDAAAMGVRRLIGVDINPLAIESARRNLAPVAGAEVHHASGDDLPLANATADVATCLEVLEHVPPALRPGVIRELARVLRPGGTLILSTPHAGFFDWLDPENARFYAGWAHGPISRWLGGNSGKERGYAGQKHGVIWHYHFQMSELVRLLSPYFQVTRIRHRACLIFPIATWLVWPFYRTRTYESFPAALLQRAQTFDALINWGESLGYNVLVVARRRCD